MPLWTRIVALTLMLPATGWMQEKKPASADAPPKPEPPPVVTDHTVTIDGKMIRYRATAGTLPLRDDSGKVTANIFHVAYTRTDVPSANRPVTFTFNGGPGSSSVWLHMGAFGPRRVEMTDEGTALPPPGKVVENELSILDLTDLVFIDPVTTGYSRAASGTEAKSFHGVQPDIESVGEFIRSWVTSTRRWGSPKFLAGESYGTTRASALVGHMQDRHGMYFNGVILISAILNFQTARFDEGNDLPHILFLPTFAATARYHQRVKGETGDMSAFLHAVESFAGGEYTTALMKGDTLSEAEQKALAEKIAAFTGLSEEYVRQTNLRIDIGRFTKQLLRDARRTVGRFDSRLKGVDSDAAGERHQRDPSYDAIQGVYTAAFNQYVRERLQYESDLPYEILTGKVSPWDFGDAKNRYLNVAPILGRALNRNHSLHLFVASGYYDMATPYFATDYTINHLNLEAEARKRITMAYYEAGHMMYAHKPSHVKLKNDLTKFYTSALKK